MDTQLANQMINRANEDDLPADHPMRVLAAEFEQRVVDYINHNCTPKTFMGAWARARRCWSDYTGEPLI